MRIDKIATSAEYRMEKQFQNLLIFEILIVFQIGQILENLLIFQVLKFWKFFNFSIHKIPEISNL